MFDKLKEKYPKAKFDIVLRAFHMADCSLQKALNKNEKVIDYNCYGYQEYLRIGFLFIWRTNQNQELAIRIDFTREYLPYPELIKMIADSYKPSYEEEI